MKKIFSPLLIVLFACMGISSFAQPAGVLDQSFGTGGIITQNLPNYNLYVMDVKVQPDQKIVVLSVLDSITHITNWGYSYLLARYQPNGVPDSSFGVNGSTGIVRFQIPYSVALQPDGKVLVSTIPEYPLTPSYAFYLTRYNTNGTLDNAFGTNGKVVTDFKNPAAPTTIYEQMPVSVFVLPNGKILQGGYAYSGFTSTFYSIVRLNADGTPDNTYGVNSRVFSPTTYIGDELFNPGYNRIPMAMVLDSSQRIVAGTGHGFTRFTANGSLDNTFGTNGQTAFTGFDQCFSGVAQPDGKTVFGGFTYDRFFLKRLNADGSFDAAFDTTPIVFAFGGGWVEEECARLILKPDGNFMFSGYSGLSGPYASPYSSFITRILSNGTVDYTYGKRGQVKSAIPLFYGNALQPDGKIIAGGNGKIERLYNNELYYNYIDADAFVDWNHNAVKDMGEPQFYNISGTATKAGNSLQANSSRGQLEFLVDTGSYVTSINSSVPYYNTVVPTSRTTAHFTYFNGDVLSFAIQPAIGKRDIRITGSALTVARPGEYVSYKLKLYNAGTDTAVNVNAILVKANLLNYISATPIADSVNYDTLRWKIDTLLPLHEFDILLLFKLNAPPLVNIGDSLISYATVSSNKPDLTAADNTSFIRQRVVGSYDPNDKSENHPSKIFLSQVAAGEYLQYTIRFQNTGNDTAFNINIYDTLDSKLNWSTLEMLDASASYQLTRDNAKCHWAFNMIKLADSIHHAATSHGFLTYRIKPKSSVQVGDVINNRAAIYFDYNLRVFTNTEHTTIVADVLLLKLLTFTAKKESKINRLKWSTANEVNVDRFEVERSVNSTEFFKIGSVKSKSESGGSYEFTDEKPETISANYYRLKMIDKDGSFTYSPVRTINNSGSFTVSAYPNPAKDKLQVQIDNVASSRRGVNLQVQVVSHDGKILLSTTWNVNEGSSVKTINTSALQSGSYFLKVTSQNPPSEGMEAQAAVVKFEKL